jgi:outer membrane putative beta-barrel porin/alpha-amylase
MVSHSPPKDRFRQAPSRNISGFPRLPPTRIPWTLLRGLCWLLVTVAVLPLSAGAEDRVPGGNRGSVEEQGPKPSWQVGGSAFYTTGKYGTNVHTDILYAPLSLRRLFDNGDLSLVIPYLTITSNCGVTVVSGVPLRTGGLCPSTATASGTFPKRVTESGLGDVLLIGRYYLYTEEERGLMPSIMVSGRVKAPTADKDRGLGTGEWDEGVGLGLTKLITDKLISFVDGGYTVIGKPEGVELRNQWSYDVGLGYYFLPTVLGSVYYEEARALLSGFQNPRDVFFGASWKLTQTFRLNAGVTKGLSNGAPDYGANIGASMRF